MRSIGASIAKIRAESGLDQFEFSERLGVSGRSFVSLVELGVRAPTWLMLCQLRREFGVSIDELIDAQAGIFANPTVNVIEN